MTLIVVLIYISLIRNIEHFFHVLFLAISMFSLEKCLRSSAHFSVGFVFLLLSHMSYLYIVETNPLSRHLQVFSPRLQVVLLLIVTDP